MICILGGEPSELAYLLGQVNIKCVKNYGKVIFYEGYQNCKSILIVSTGYGKVNLSFALGYVLGCYDIESIIVVGNCGAMGYEDAPLGSVAIASISLQFDVDFTALGYEQFQTPGISVSEYPSCPKLTQKAIHVCENQKIKYYVGIAGTVDSFVASTSCAHDLTSNYHIDFVDNESGVAGQISYLYKKPCICIKGISNYGTDDAEALYKNNQETANEAANKVTFGILCELASEFCCK